MRKLIVLLSLALVYMSCVQDISECNFKIVAHRGYWKAAEGAQNSIRAFDEAVRLGIEGVELDVRQTKDGILILHHDATAGDFVISESNLSEIRTLRLPDGSLIPTLEEYFEHVRNHQQIELYIDVKTIGSTETIIDMLVKYGLDDRAVLLTSYEVGVRAVAYKDNISVHCMTTANSPSVLKENGFTGIGLDIEFLKNHIDWIDQAHSLGLQVGCWVVKSESEIIWCSHHDLDYATTDAPLECKRYLQK